MEILYDTDYMQIRFDKTQDFITIIRKTATENMTVEEFKRDNLMWAKYMQEKKPSKMLVDGQNFKFLIEPELQHWLDENLISPAIKAGLKKYVYVMPKELYITISLDQTLAQKHPMDINHLLLTDIDEAKIWLGVTDKNQYN